MSSEGMERFPRSDRRQPIETAPRNGLTIIVGHDDCGQFAMHWEPQAQNGLFPGAQGFWVSLDRSFTWSEHDGAGPDYWFHIPDSALTPSES